nr:MAG TPA: hypothetical protein [Crassvirales sp.]
MFDKKLETILNIHLRDSMFLEQSITFIII